MSKRELTLNRQFPFFMLILFWIHKDKSDLLIETHTFPHPPIKFFPLSANARAVS